MASIREKILSFIVSPKDIPLLAGFSIGLYLVVFIYARNFGMYNSLPQFLAFLIYYMLLPMAFLYLGYKLMTVVKLGKYRRHFLFVGIIAILAYFLLEFNYIVFSKKIAFAVIVTAAILLSFLLRNYYKLLVLLLFLMCAFNIPMLAGNAANALTVSREWLEQPDDIESIAFKRKPNIYYIQPDGYTNFNNLQDSIHNFDNSGYEAYLKDNGFTLYRDYRSNYASTLLSNSSMFAMKHHYAAKDVESYAARSIIISDNPVLATFRNNSYKTAIITQNPYLIMNRPKMGFDYCNIAYEDIPYIRDGFSIGGNVMGDFKVKASKDAKSGNFYFVEKFLPGHISVYANGNTIEQEKELYLDNLRKANIWLKEIITFIVQTDPEGIIIIGADHGGYCGFAAMQDVLAKTQDPALLQSVFGAQLAIRWNDASHTEYDKELKTGVNLFRTVFSFLAEDKKYLRHLEDDGSYMPIKQPKGVFRFLDDNGKVVFDEK